MIIRLCFFLLISISFLNGQDTCSIEGYVHDAITDVPVPGANVIIENSYIGASTDINGKYIIKVLLSGRYTMIVLYPGYKTIRYDSLEIKSNKYFLNFTLEEDPDYNYISWFDDYLPKQPCLVIDSVSIQKNLRLVDSLLINDKNIHLRLYRIHLLDRLHENKEECITELENLLSVPKSIELYIHRYLARLKGKNKK